MRGGDPQVPVVGVYLPLAGGIMTGNIVEGGASQIKTPGGSFYEVGGDFQMRNLADLAYIGLQVALVQIYQGIYYPVSGLYFQAPNIDDSFILINARDNGVAPIEVARLQGAADPYFQATLPMRLLPAAAPVTILEGHFWYDATDDVLKYRDAAVTRTVISIFTPITPVTVTQALGAAGWIIDVDVSTFPAGCAGKICVILVRPNVASSSTQNAGARDVDLNTDCKISCWGATKTTILAKVSATRTLDLYREAAVNDYECIGYF